MWQSVVRYVERVLFLKTFPYFSRKPLKGFTQVRDSLFHGLEG